MEQKTVFSRIQFLFHKSFALATAVVNELARNLTREYLEKRNRPIVRLDAATLEALDGSLGSADGELIYQEDGMHVASALSGLGLDFADSLRRELVLNLQSNHRRRFSSSCQERDLHQHVIDAALDNLFASALTAVAKGNVIAAVLEAVVIDRQKTNKGFVQNQRPERQCF